MKFSTFFGKYTICALIYSAISMVIGIAGFGALYAMGKRAEKKDEDENPITASDMNLSND